MTSLTNSSRGQEQCSAWKMLDIHNAPFYQWRRDFLKIIFAIELLALSLIQSHEESDFPGTAEILGWSKKKKNILTIICFPKQENETDRIEPITTASSSRASLGDQNHSTGLSCLTKRHTCVTARPNLHLPVSGSPLSFVLSLP